VTDLDVIVVGAGLSGIDAAYRLTTECPSRSFTVLEARDAIGGTWDLFRYPGVRSDSDMFTLGYPFHPWKSAKTIADGESILSYVRETARKFGIEPRIRFKHRVVAARWSSSEARWTVEVEVGEERRREQLRSRFLYLCCGYYDYASAYAPQFPGVERFTGRVVHPQWWPKDLDYTGKRVVIIGSGATAVTLVPAMVAGGAAHVTMLQRTPSWVFSLPDRDLLADLIRAVLPDELAHGLVRTKNMLRALAFFLFCRWKPKLAGAFLKREAARKLPKGYPVEKHFAPSYAPWDQRLCIVPNADLFEAIAKGRAAVVTDTIASFDERGIALSSGERVDADVVVTATGLKLLPIGGVRLSLDGRTVERKDALVYKGMMLGDVPNLAWCVGYTNASWTLRADLSARYLCRMLNFMAERGYEVFMPRAETAGPGRQRLLALNSGYIDRALSEMPQQGDAAPWVMRQNYVLDFFTTIFGRLDDEAMEFSAAVAAPHPLRRPDEQPGASTSGA
jgi:monooxygenase